MRKVAAVFSALLILSLGLAGSFVAVSGTVEASHGTGTVIVDDDGPSTNDTIQAGVNHADPGDTVLVRAGTYEESVVVNTTGIDIVTVEGATLDGSAVSGPAFNITNEAGNVSNVGVRGFTITDYDTGVSIVGTNVTGDPALDMRNITVLNNTIMNAAGAGVSVHHESGEFRLINVANNTVANAGDGVSVNVNGSAATENVTVFNNSLDDGVSGSAVSVATRDTATLTDVLAAVNNGSGADTGLDVHLADSASISDLNATANDFSATTGNAIAVETSTTTTTGTSLDGFEVNTNLLNGSAGDGIAIDASGTAEISALEIESNDLRNNAYGIDVFADSAQITGLSVTEALTSGATEGGVNILGVSGATITGVDITDSGLNETDGTGLTVAAEGGSSITDFGLDTVAAGDNAAGIVVYANGTSTIANVSADTVLANGNDQLAAGLFAGTANGNAATIENVTFAEAGLNDTASGTGLAIQADGAASITGVSLDTVDASNNSRGLDVFAAGDSRIADLSTDTVLFGESNGDAGVIGATGTAEVENISFATSGFNESAGTGLQVLATGDSDVTDVSLDTVTVGGNAEGLNVSAFDSARIADVSLDTVLASGTDDRAAGIFAGSPGSASTAEIENVGFDTVGLNDTVAGAGLRVESWGAATVASVSLDTVTLSNNTVGTRIFANENSAITNIDSDTALFGGNDDRGVRLRAGQAGTGSDALISDVAFSTVGLNDTDVGAGLRIDSWGTSEVSNVNLGTIDASNNSRGLLVSAGEDSRIADISADTVLFGESNGDAAVLRATDAATVEGVSFETVGLNKSDGTGLQVLATDTGTVTDVSLDTVLASNNTVGMNLSAVDDSTISAVRAETVLFSDNVDGVRIGAEDGALIEQVRIVQSGLNGTTNGIVFDGSGTYSNVRVKESLIQDNDVGVVVTPETSAEGLRVIRSLIADNGFGIDNRNATSIFDARNNWWGDSSGPSSAPGGDTPYADPVNGKLAIGDGDSVSEGATPGVSNVRFDPAIGGKNRDQSDDQIIDPVTFVEGTNGVPANFSVEFAGVTIEGPISDFVGLNIWERSVLPFRASADDAAQRVRTPQVFIRTSEGDVSVNRDFLKVYQSGQQLNITFEETNGADTSRFANKEVQFHVFRANDTESLSNLFEQSINTTTGEISLGSDAVDVVELRDLGQLDENGEVSVEFTPARPGEYLFALTTVESGDGFELNDTGTDRISANVLNDSTVFAGFEAITVQKTSSEVTPEKDRVLTGERLNFTAQSNLASSDVNHALLLYDKLAFERQQITIDDPSLEMSGDNVLINVTGTTRENGTAPVEPFLLSINATQDCDPANSSVPMSIEDAEDNPCVNDITISGSLTAVPSSASIVLAGGSTQAMSITVPSNVSFEGTEKPFQFVHVAVSSDNPMNRSTDVGTITVEKRIPDIEVNRTSIAFGDRIVGSSRTATVAVRNNGTGALNLTDVSIAGMNADQFAVTAGGETVLDPGEETTISVTFTPMDAGSLTAQLEIASNDPDQPTTTVALTGSGIPSESDIVPAPSQLSFGTINVGTSATLSVTLTNNGTIPVDLSSVAITGRNAGQFEVAGSGPTALAPGESTTIDIKYAPAVVGTSIATLEIGTNETDSPTVFVPLSGAAVTPQQPTEIETIVSSPDEFRFLIRNLRASQDVNLSTPGLGDADVMFDGVNFRTSPSISAANAVDIRFRPSTTAPPEASPLTGAGEVPRYLNVTPVGIDDDDIENVRFRFRVSESRLGDRDPENVAFYRFSDGTWSSLDTEFVRTTNTGWHRFVATSPGFSAFAVALQEPNLSITDTTLDPETVVINENATASATIENTGSVGGNFTAGLTVDGVLEETKTVFVPAGESRTVDFTVSFDQIGSYDLAINGTDVGTLTVLEPPVISVDPASIDFGDVEVGETATDSVTVTNDGDVPIELTSTAITGADAGAFSIASAGASTLAPGASTTVDITFAPASTGAKSATLELGTNVSDTAPATVALAGTGTLTPDIARSPTSISFGTVTTIDSATRKVVVANFGNAPLEITSTDITGMDDGEFTVVESPSSPVAPGEQTTLRIRFAPSSIGPKTAQLEIASNDPDEGVVTVPLIGMGAGVPEISASPMNVDFGTVTIGDSATEDATVTNTGDANLTITSVSVTGSDADAFSGPDADTPITLAPGESVTGEITFSPSTTGEKTATLRIESDDPAQSATLITLSGTGQALPDIAVDPTSVDFGEVSVGETATDSVSVSNDGGSPLDLSSVSVTGSDAGAFSVTDEGDATVAPGETTTVQIEFAPDSEGDKSATLEIESNDPDDATVTVDLSGSGAVTTTEPPVTTTEPPVTTTEPPTTTTEPPVTTTDPSEDDGPPVALIVIVIILIIVGILAALYFRGGPGFGDTGGG